ncbi:MAG: PAS domain S-box protein [Chloroflexi bacterium]|nr:PAS domain S-box protein [Chloroflexota bacterium]
MSDQPQITKNTLAIYLPTFILMIVVTVTILMVVESIEISDYQNTEWRSVDIQKASADRIIQQIAADLSLLSNQREMEELWDDDGAPIPEVLADLTAEYLNFSTYRELYDQIRLIDENGMEIVRVNFNNGHPAIVSREELQNKEGSYYFDDAIVLNRGEVFVSPLDLNIEHGEIEQPLKPMIRFATPVFDQHGTKRGIVLLNFFGAEIIKSLSQQPNNRVMLLNTNGYWLKGSNLEDEWGFMYEGRTDRTFANTYPDAWDRIMHDEFSQFETQQGMFTFKTIYPLIEGQKSSTGSGEAFFSSMAQLEAKEYYWKVVSFVPSNVLYADRNNRRIYVAVVLVAVALATFFGVRRITVAVAFRQQVEKALHVAYAELEQRVEERTKDLSQSEEKFRNLFETMAQGVVYQDARGHIFSANLAAERILGLTLDQMQGRTSVDPRWKAIHEDGSDFPGKTHPGMVALRTGKPVSDVVMGIFHPNEGQHRWININAIPQFRPGESAPYQNYSTFDDITERVWSEEALRESEELHRLTLSAISDAVFITDDAGDFTFISPNVNFIFNYSFAEVEQMRNIAILLGDSLFDFDMLIATKEIQNIERTIVDKTGQEHIILVTAKRVSIGEGTILYSCRDITERHRVDRLLQTSEARYRNIFENAGVPILEEDFSAVMVALDDLKARGVTDFSAYLEEHPEFVQQAISMVRIIDVNEAVLRLYKAQSKEELVGSLDKVFVPESQQFFKQQLIFMAEDRTLFEHETIGQTLQGERLNLLLTLAIPPSTTKFDTLLASLLDITERKQAQEALQKAHDELEQRVQKRTEELAAANTRLKELDQHKDKFIEDMSHELRTPLTTLKMYLELLERGKPEKQAKYMDILRQTAQRLIKFSEGVLTITRLNLYKDDIDAIPLDLNNIIANVIQQQQHVADKAGLQLMFIPHTPLPHIMGERSQLYKVVVNLLQNSLNYTPEGQIQVSTFFDETRQQICLQTSDTGIGIEEDELPFLFDRFYRGQHVGQFNIPGIGLGLTVVKEVVELHGGSVDVESQRGQGSTFRVWLPVAVN